MALTVAEAIRASQSPLRLRGAGTWLSAGRPVNASQLLDLSPHAGVVEYVPGDLTITVKGGTSLGEIARVTAEHGQWLTLDPCGDDRGTIGATIATASYGPLASGFGTPRDLVLGVEFVTGTGAVVRGGGRVVKNVAGFDLTRLITGSWGTLGAITEVSLRLRARPEVDETLAIAVETHKSALQQLGASLRALPFNLFAAELVDAPMAARIGLEPRAQLLVRFGGTEAVAAAHRATLLAIGDGIDLPASTWEKLRAADVDASTIRLSRRPSEFPMLWRECTALLSETGGAAHAQPLRGVVRIIVPDAAAPRDTAWLTREGETRQVCERMPAHWWQYAGNPPLAHRLPQAVRAAFDPNGVLNPGILGES